MSYHLERYKKYKNINVICCFCERETNLYAIFKHTTSKRCLTIQLTKYNEEELKDKKLKLLILIDNLRQRSRNGIIDDDV